MIAVQDKEDRVDTITRALLHAVSEVIREQARNAYRQGYKDGRVLGAGLVRWDDYDLKQLDDMAEAYVLQLGEDS